MNYKSKSFFPAAKNSTQNLLRCYFTTSKFQSQILQSTYIINMRSQLAFTAALALLNTLVQAAPITG